MSYYPNNELRFCLVAKLPNNELRFGECNLTPPSAYLNADALLTVSVTIASVARLFYNSQVSRQISPVFNVGHCSASIVHKETRLNFTFSKHIFHTANVIHSETKATSRHTKTNWAKPIPILMVSKMAYSDGLKIQSNIRLLWPHSKQIHTTNRDLYSAASSVPYQVKSIYSHAVSMPIFTRAIYTQSLPSQNQFRFLSNEGKPARRLFNIRYTHGSPLSPGKHVLIPIPNPLPRPNHCGNTLVFRKFYGINELRFLPCLSSIIIVPTRRVYFVPNSFSLVRTSNSIEIKTISFSMNLDSDSFAWSWNATVDPSQISQVLSLDQLNPIDVVATINGIPFNLIIEKVSTNRSFCDKSVSISGRSNIAYLSAPYASVTTAYSSAAIYAQQAAESALTINGTSIGWAIDWQLQDWLIANGAWTNTGTYIEHLTKIAESGAGYVQPHDTADTVLIKPYYPTAPWNWDTANIVLPEAVVVNEGIEYSFKPAYTGVYIHGGASGGRLDLVKKTDTPGDDLAPIVVDDLATDPIMTRQRGLMILADTGTFANVTISLPVLPETGIIRPGTLVQYNNRIGMVRSVAVAVEYCKTSQTLELETHEYL